MATQLSRSTLKQLFGDGERPTGDNFASAWMSFLSQNDDQISYNATNNNIELGANTGLVLGNPTVGAIAGTLRFNSGTGSIQFYNGTVFKDIAGGTGAFVPVGAGPAVAFNLGNVGIGTQAAVPTHVLEIPLGANTHAGQEILLGKLIVHNGTADDGAYIGNNALATNPTGYALFQNSNGKTIINASSNAGSQLSLAINNVDKFVIANNGSMGIDGDVSIGSVFGGGHILNVTNVTTGTTGFPALTLTGDTSGSATAIATLVVNGVAQKTNGGGWIATSDRRVKKEIRPFEEGLQKLLLFDPVVYKFNGKGGTIDNGKDYIGLIAQDVKKIMPELIITQHIKLLAEDNKESEVLGHDLSPLTFLFINAIKELATRVEKLEKSKKNANRKNDHSTGADH